MIKYKLSEIAKNLNISSKEVSEVLKNYLNVNKKSAAVLTEEELNLIFEYFTHKTMLPNLNEYYASATEPADSKAEETKSAKKEQPAKTNNRKNDKPQQKKQEQQKTQKPENKEQKKANNNDKPAQNQSRNSREMIKELRKKRNSLPLRDQNRKHIFSAANSWIRAKRLQRITAR